MAVLPSASGAETVGIQIVSVADNAGIDSAKAGLTSLDAEAAASNKSAGGASNAWSNASNSLKSAGAAMTATGKSLSTYVSLPIAAIGIASTKMAMDFQQSMELLHTNAGVPQSSIASLSNKVLDLAGVVGFSPNSLAQAFYHIATAGQGIFSTSQQLQQLKVAAEGAAIGQASLDDTTYALTSTLAANVKGATDFTATMGTLLAIVQAGDMHLSDLNEVIGTGLMGTLSTFGVSLQSAGAALADFGDLGEKGAIAGTRLRMMLTLMASPSAAAAKILGDLGLTTGQASDATSQMNAVFAKTGLTTTKLADDLRSPNGIYTAIMDLKTHLEATGMSVSQVDTVLAKAFGGGRTDAALLQLLNTTDRLDLKYKQIGTDSGNFSNNWVAQQQTMKQQWDKAWGAIQADMIRLGEAIMPSLSKALGAVSKAIGDLSSWFQGLSKGQQQTIIDVALLLAALGPLLVILGGLVTLISALISPIGAVVAGMAILGGLAIANRNHFKEWGAEIEHIWKLFTGSTPIVIITQYFQQVMLPALKAIWGALSKDLGPAFEQLWKSIQRLWQAIEPAFTDLLKILAVLIGATLFLAVWALLGVINILIRTFSFVVSAISNVINWIANLISWFGNLVGIVVNTVKTIITIFSNLWPAVKDVVGLVVGAFAGLGGAILHVLGDAGKWLYQTGKNIIAGLLNGIEDAIKGVGSALGHVAGDVGHAVSGALHAIHIPGFATGTSYAPGGWAMVGENGPEAMYVPRGAQIKTNSQSGGGVANNTNQTVNIGTVVLQTQAAATEFFKQLNQDTMNLGKGLTARQGA